MRYTLLIAASLFLAPAAHAQSDEDLGYQMLHARASLSESQGELADAAYLRYGRSLKVVRPDGTHTKRGDPDIMVIARIGFRCNLSILASIRANRITTVTGAVNEKLRCFQSGLNRNPQTKGFTAYLEN